MNMLSCATHVETIVCLSLKGEKAPKNIKN